MAYNTLIYSQHLFWSAFPVPSALPGEIERLCACSLEKAIFVSALQPRDTHAGVCKLLFLPSASFTGMAFALVLSRIHNGVEFQQAQIEKPHMCPPKGPLLAQLLFLCVHIMNALVFLFWRISPCFCEKSLRSGGSIHCPLKACFFSLSRDVIYFTRAAEIKMSAAGLVYERDAD
jgi:hypothetical protein